VDIVGIRFQAADSEDTEDFSCAIIKNRVERSVGLFKCSINANTNQNPVFIDK
jgi:hypothetical protein